MTTIIINNGEMVADRRKVVTHYNTSSMITGVRDEAKIHRLPFCFYGISGVDTRTSISGERVDNKQKVIHMLAILFGLRYFASFDYILKIDDGENNVSLTDYFEFQKNVDGIVSILGCHLATILEEKQINVIAMDRNGALQMKDGTFSTYSLDDFVCLGVGIDYVSILISNGYSYQEIFDGLRWSAHPTGTKLDIFNKNELEELFPPVMTEVFLETVVMWFKEAVHNGDVKEIIDTQEKMEKGFQRLTCAIASILTIGKYKDNAVHLNPHPIFNFDYEYTHKHTAWKQACEFTGYVPPSLKRKKK